MRTHRNIARRALAVVLALASAACSDIVVPDLNNPGLGDLQNNPTRAGILTAATGLQVGGRANWGSQNGPVPILGIVGREGYNLDAADPRFVTSMLIGPLSGGDPAFGGNLWGLYYLNIRNTNILINATNAIVTDPAAGLTAEEKQGVLGYARTIKALDLLNVILVRDSNGAAIDVDIDPTGAPAAIVDRATVYAYVASLLDSAYTNLTSTGASFPFALSGGYTGFDTPATFATVNRGIRARAAVYNDDFAAALTALALSFVDTLQPLSRGIYHVFGTGSGDLTNGLFDPDARALFAHPSMETDAALQPGGARDLRFLTKVDSLFDDLGNHDTTVVQGISTHLRPALYSSPTTSVPIIRNEELVLLRAEANIGQNALVPALADINYVRRTAGGLANLAIGGQTQATLRTELLYNKRYSLFWEGGFRWFDMRHYGLMNTLPQAVGTHRRFTRFPFPINECTPRQPTPPAGCADVIGF